MVRRLQPSTPAATATPVAAVLEPPALNPQSSTTAVAPANHPTFAMTPELAKAFALSGSTQTQPELVEGVGTPYVMFYDKRAEQASKIAAKLPHVAAGDPILVVAGDYEAVKSTAFVILDEFQFWVESDTATFKPVAWRLDQPAGKGDWKEQVLCLLLLLTDEPILTLTTLRTTKCPVAKSMRKAVQHAQTPEAIKGDTFLGAMVQANFPPRYRVTGSFVTTPKSGKFAYVEADARCATTKPEQGVAIMNWFSSPEGQDEHKLLRAAFDEQVADVRKKAAAKR